MKVIGYRDVSFQAKDGNHVEGVSLYLSYPLGKHGEGEACEKVFLSRRVLEHSSYSPVIGDSVDFTYNKYGKVVSIYPD